MVNPPTPAGARGRRKGKKNDTTCHNHHNNSNKSNNSNNSNKNISFSAQLWGLFVLPCHAVLLFCAVRDLFVLPCHSMLVFGRCPFRGCVCMLRQWDSANLGFLFGILLLMPLLLRPQVFFANFGIVILIVFYWLTDSIAWLEMAVYEF